ncbi:hypothetical protein NKT77_02760 [Moraxella sp. FZLJ2107]|nr:hypothetical protein [Moraxella sp. FZLJ2107]UTO05590.1 hypothetical protein NKT77_02760 [Moraxella sp. FZLJ2107]
MGILPALLDGMRHILTKASRGVAATAFTSLGINVLVGEQYLSLLLSGNAFFCLNTSGWAYIQKTYLVPLKMQAWSSIRLCRGACMGAFFAGTFGMPVIDYVPYAFFCYLCFVLTLIFGFTGFTITKLPSQAK